MSLFQAAVIINQVATNAQLAVVNARIGQLLNNHAADRNEQARVAHARELVFQVREYLDLVRQESDPRFGYFQLLGYQRALMNAGISPSSFTAFDEKEYARGVFQAMHDTFVQIERDLGGEVVERIQYLHRLNLAVPHFAEVANWEEIIKLFPGKPWFFRYWRWVAFSFLIPIHLFLVAHIVVGREDSHGFVFVAWFLQLFYVLGAFAIYKLRIRSVLPRIKEMAARNGGWATNAISEDDSRIVLEQQKQFLTNLGFEVPTENAPEVFRQRLNELDQLIKSLHLPLQLNYS